MKAKKKKRESRAPLTHWLVPVEQLKDSDDLFIILPPKLLRVVGWKEGDTIFWTPKKNGYLLTKVEKH